MPTWVETAERVALVGADGEAGRQPGWYEDPRAEAGWRYWDGLSWTPFAHGELAIPGGQPVAARSRPSGVARLGHAPASHVRSVIGARRYLLVALPVSLIHLALYVAILALVRSGAGADVVIGLALLSVLASVVVIALALVAMYRLKDPLEYGAIVLVPCLLLVLVDPVGLGLIVLLFLYWKATAYLRTNGIPASFLGMRT
jgi:Protein of unknown function (DUF2510)